jgi:hypothetical protein
MKDTTRHFSRRQTVHTFVQRAMRKLGAQTREQAVAEALRRKLMKWMRLLLRPQRDFAAQYQAMFPHGGPISSCSAIASIVMPFDSSRKTRNSRASRRSGSLAACGMRLVLRPLMGLAMGWNRHFLGVH